MCAVVWEKETRHTRILTHSHSLKHTSDLSEGSSENTPGESVRLLSLRWRSLREAKERVRPHTRRHHSSRMCAGVCSCLRVRVCVRVHALHHLAPSNKGKFIKYHERSHGGHVHFCFRPLFSTRKGRLVEESKKNVCKCLRERTAGIITRSFILSSTQATWAKKDLTTHRMEDPLTGCYQDKGGWEEEGESQASHSSASQLEGECGCMRVCSFARVCLCF